MGRTSSCPVGMPMWISPCPALGAAGHRAEGQPEKGHQDKQPNFHLALEREGERGGLRDVRVRGGLGLESEDGVERAAKGTLPVSSQGNREKHPKGVMRSHSRAPLPGVPSPVLTIWAHISPPSGESRKAPSRAGRAAEGPEEPPGDRAAPGSPAMPRAPAPARPRAASRPSPGGARERPRCPPGRPGWVRPGPAQRAGGGGRRAELPRLPQPLQTGEMLRPLLYHPVRPCLTCTGEPGRTQHSRGGPTSGRTLLNLLAMLCLRSPGHHESSSCLMFTLAPPGPSCGPNVSQCGGWFLPRGRTLHISLLNHRIIE